LSVHFPAGAILPFTRFDTEKAALTREFIAIHRPLVFRKSSNKNSKNRQKNQEIRHEGRLGTLFLPVRYRWVALKPHWLICD
jgi:hypothetical protein